MADCFGNYIHVGKDKNICATCANKKECARELETNLIKRKLEIHLATIEVDEDGWEM